MTPAQKMAAIAALITNRFLTARGIASQSGIPLQDVHGVLETIRQSQGRLGYLASRPGPRGGYALVSGPNSGQWLFTQRWVQAWRISMGLRPSQSPLL